MLKQQSLKFSILLTIIFITLAILVANVFAVSVMGYHFYTGTNIKPQAESIHIAKQTLYSRRGRILDTNGTVIASDVQTYDMIAIIDSSRPSQKGEIAYVADKELTAQQLAPILGMDKEAILTGLNQENLYQVQFGNYSRRLSLSQKEAIEALDLPGIEFTPSYNRQYPLGLFASNTVGFAAYDQDTQISVGHLGIEQKFDTELVGTNGERYYQKSSNGYILDDTTIQETPAINGQDVYMTIDQSIQESLDVAISETKAAIEAENLFGVVMEVETGKILAISQDPAFNLKDKAEDMVYTNRIIDLTLEPGSTFKAITFAAAIDSGNYDGDELFDSTRFYLGIDEQGKPYRSPVPTNYGSIQNASDRSWGFIPYDSAFKYSSNVGTSMLVLNMGPEVFEHYIKAFKFTEPIETDRFVTAPGNLVFNYPIEQINVSFGQGVTLNPLQMLQAYSAILNDGIMVKPYFIDKIVNTSTNEVTYQSQTDIIGHPILSSTADKLQDLMLDCVEAEDGTCKEYKIEDTQVIAKTGTAQMVIDGKYDADQHIHSVVAALPYEDPKVVVYYGYQGGFDLSNFDKKDGIKSLLKTLALKYDPLNVNEEIQYNQLQVTKVPQLKNHSLEYVNSAIASTGLEVVRIGDGTQVIDQLPKANSDILSNQRLILLTSQSNWLMPDMSNWALKDITNFWSLTGIQVQFSGSGKVVEQSIAPGQEINLESLIEVKLK